MVQGSCREPKPGVLKKKCPFSGVKSVIFKGWRWKQTLAIYQKPAGWTTFFLPWFFSVWRSIRYLDFLISENLPFFLVKVKEENAIHQQKQQEILVVWLLKSTTGLETLSHLEPTKKVNKENQGQKTLKPLGGNPLTYTWGMRQTKIVLEKITCWQKWDLPQTLGFFIRKIFSPTTYTIDAQIICDDALYVGILTEPWWPSKMCANIPCGIWLTRLGLILNHTHLPVLDAIWNLKGMVGFQASQTWKNLSFWMHMMHYRFKYKQY